jgi:hypothetical protein
MPIHTVEITALLIVLLALAWLVGVSLAERSAGSPNAGRRAGWAAVALSALVVALAVG